MPHFTIEYSANLAPHLDAGKLCETVRRAAIETEVFPVGGIRVRAICFANYSIADGAPENGFVDLTLRMGQGRDAATKTRAGDHVFAALRRAVAPAAAATTLAISFNVYEIESAFSWKDNAIHDALERRLQPPGSAADGVAKSVAEAVAPGRSA